MSATIGEENPVYAPFFGAMGAVSAIVFSGKFLIHSIYDVLSLLLFELNQRMIISNDPEKYCTTTRRCLVE